MFHFIPEKNITNDNFYKFDIYFLVAINAAIPIPNFRHTQSLSLKRRGTKYSKVYCRSEVHKRSRKNYAPRSATWHVTIY